MHMLKTGTRRVCTETAVGLPSRWGSHLLLSKNRWLWLIRHIWPSNRAADCIWMISSNRLLVQLRSIWQTITKNNSTKVIQKWTRKKMSTYLFKLNSFKRWPRVINPKKRRRSRSQSNTKSWTPLNKKRSQRRNQSRNQTTSQRRAKHIKRFLKSSTYAISKIKCKRSKWFSSTRRRLRWTLISGKSSLLSSRSSRSLPISFPSRFRI